MINTKFKVNLEIIKQGISNSSSVVAGVALVAAGIGVAALVVGRVRVTVVVVEIIYKEEVDRIVWSSSRIVVVCMAVLL